MAVSPGIKKTFSELLARFQGEHAQVPETLLDRPNQIIFPALSDPEQGRHEFLDAVEALPHEQGDGYGSTIPLDLAAMGPDVLEPTPMTDPTAPPRELAEHSDMSLNEQGRQKLGRIIERAKNKHREDVAPPLNL